jgi:hypothetical protein
MVTFSLAYGEVEEIATPIPTPRSPTSLLGLAESGERTLQSPFLTEAESHLDVLAVLAVILRET